MYSLYTVVSSLHFCCIYVSIDLHKSGSKYSFSSLDRWCFQLCPLCHNHHLDRYLTVVLCSLLPASWKNHLQFCFKDWGIQLYVYGMHIMYMHIHVHDVYVKLRVGGLKKSLVFYTLVWATCSFCRDDLNELDRINISLKAKTPDTIG